ncbi:serine/threonine protein kinase [Enhygromyxa salina]|uniref:Serine/threonine protein kinase n=2 Tax=Enhygromyxa salina TaxID=215803 RepID=A0A0C2D8X5_9BACT|nr:serine/threonine protein kinase [Enhygromyxa salina]
MGEVWIARRPALGGASKLVAIKTLLATKAHDPTARRMFLDEARISMLMSNSNIVQVFDAAQTDDGTCYLAMEYVEGIDLANLTEQLEAKGETLSHSAIGYIIGELLKALAYAHELDHEGTRRTIVHRDISPHNVMLSRSGEVKLMDFGIARLASEETSGSFAKGKLRYMPPEQLDGETKAPTIDLFPIGAILHELLDGKRFRGGALEETRLVGIVARGEIPPLSCPPERVPAIFEQLRRGLLAPASADRIASAREAHRLLSQWPGDRDARFELEEIIQRFVSSSSLPSVMIDVDPPALEGIATELFARGGSETATARRPAGEESASARQRGIAATSRSAPRLAPARQFRRVPRVPLALGSVTLLALLGMGAGLLVWWSDDDEPARAATTPEPVQPEPSEPVQLERPEPAAPKLEPLPVARVPKEAPPPKPEPAPKPKPNTKPKPKPNTNTNTNTKPNTKPKPNTNTMTSVTITATGVYAQVKLGSKVYTLDHLSGQNQESAKVEPGEYTVRFRDDPEAAWQQLGTVNIPADGPVKLQVASDSASVTK